MTSTLHLVREDLRAFLDILPTRDWTVEHIGAMRQMLGMMPVAESSAEVAVEERFIPGPAGAPDVRVLIYRPVGVAAPMPAILHLHGGGFVIGKPEISDAENRDQALALGATIVSVDYRKAPETVFPGPVEDCYAALSWVHGHAASLGIDAARIAVKGESAGGNLAAALALMARDRGGPAIAFQCLVYPMLDDRADDRNAFAGEFICTRQNDRTMWSAYLGREPGQAGVSPYAAPARAADLSGLPPAQILVGALDLFIDENIDYAQRLLRAGVPTELHVYPGCYHAFQAAGDTHAHRRYRRDVIDALSEALA